VNAFKKVPVKFLRFIAAALFGFLRPNLSAIRNLRMMHFASLNRRRASAAVNIRPRQIGLKAQRYAA